MKRFGRILVVAVIGVAVFVAYYWSAKGMRAYEQAEHFRRTGRLDQAIAEYERAIEGNPRRGVFYFGLARTLQARGEYALALEACDRARRCEPDELTYDSRYHLIEGILLADEGRWGEAIRALDRCREGCRDSIMRAVGDRIVADARLRREAGEHDAAESELMTALGVSDGDCRLFFELALNCREMGQPGRAIRYFEKAAALAPDCTRYHYELGRTYRATGRYPEAIAAFSRAGDFGDAHQLAAETRSVERERCRAVADSLCAEAVSYLLQDTTLYSEWTVAKERIDRAIELCPAERRYRLVSHDLLVDELAFFRGSPSLRIRIEDRGGVDGGTLLEVTVRNGGPAPLSVGAANFSLVAPDGRVFPARNGGFPVRVVPPGGESGGLLRFDSDVRPATLVCTGTGAERVVRSLPAPVY